MWFNIFDCFFAACFILAYIFLVIWCRATLISTRPDGRLSAKSRRSLLRVKCGSRASFKQSFRSRTVDWRFEAKWLPNDWRFYYTHSTIVVPQSSKWKRTQLYVSSKHWEWAFFDWSAENLGEFQVLVLEIPNMARKDWFCLRAQCVQEERLSHQSKGKRLHFRLYRMDRSEKPFLGRFGFGSSKFHWGLCQKQPVLALTTQCRRQRF